MATKYNNIFLFSGELLHVLITLKSIHPSPTVLALGQNHLLITLKARFNHCMFKSTIGAPSFNSQSGHAVGSRSQQPPSFNPTASANQLNDRGSRNTGFSLSLSLSLQLEALLISTSESITTLSADFQN